MAGVLIATHCGAAGGAVALLPWSDEETLAEWCVAQMMAAGVGDIEVVTGCEGERLIAVVAGDNVEPVPDRRWREDAASALRGGVSAVPRGTEAVLLCDVRAPRDAAFLRALLDAHEASGAALAVPSHGGVPPLVAGGAALGQLRNAHGEDALAALIARGGHDIHVVRVDASRAHADVHDGASVAAARRLLGG